MGTDLTPLGHGDRTGDGIKVQEDEVHAVLGEFHRYCWTSNSWANETWQSTPQQGHSDTEGAAQCRGDPLPRLSCLKAYFMLQRIKTRMQTGAQHQALAVGSTGSSKD